MAYHYKSRVAIGRLPLVHIAIGPNPEGEEVVPVAVLAIGAKAYGVFAVGWFANGFFVVTWIGMGLIGGIGQFIFGGAVLGQFCAGLFALGQYAVGPFAIGQWSLGWQGLGDGGWVYQQYNWLPGFIQAVDWHKVRHRFEYLAPGVMLWVALGIAGLFILAIFIAIFRESLSFLTEWRKKGVRSGKNQVKSRNGRK